MKQFILRSGPDKNGFVRLTGEDFHYLARVRRIRADSAINCRLPSGKVAALKIVRVEKNALIAECVETSDKACVKSEIPPIILFQSMVKGTKMDIIVRQAGETGITEIVPFYSEHSVPRLAEGAGSGQARTDRWRRILRMARQQSNSAVSADVAEPRSSLELFDYWARIKCGYKAALALLIHEIPLEKNSFHEYLDDVPDLVVLAVGPEGGFSPAEADTFAGAGFKPVTLGDTVLRAESAALYATAIVRTLIFERQTWTTKTN
jgi:16S rRNA (uracil1498-N3)-methyltransferase